MASKAHSNANQRYRQKAYDRMEIQAPKGSKAALQGHAANRDKSLNAFILRAIMQTLRDDGAPPEVLAAVSGSSSGDSSGD